eukprot:scaffold67467_cov19-Tisochrysis_lutea.AAC.1
MVGSQQPHFGAVPVSWEQAWTIKGAGVICTDECVVGVQVPHVCTLCSSGIYLWLAGSAVALLTQGASPGSEQACPKVRASCRLLCTCLFWTSQTLAAFGTLPLTERTQGCARPLSKVNPTL